MKHETKFSYNIISMLINRFSFHLKEFREQRYLSKEISTLPEYIKQDIGMDEETRKEQHEKMVLQKAVKR